MKQLVIVGGVAGGASAAARARRLDEQADIILLERGPEISFANCGLPYFLGEEIAERSALLLQTPASFSQRFNVDVRVNHEVVAIDRAVQQLLVRDLNSGVTYQLHYDKLLLSPGAKPIRPPLPGCTLPSVLTLRNLTDMDAIHDAVSHHQTEHVTIVGGGFIGLEVAEQLARRNLHITLLERDGQLMPPLDAEMALPLLHALRAQGIEVKLNTALSAIQELHHGLQVQLSDGSAISTHLVILALGIEPENTLAKTAGLSLGEHGGIVVNGQMQTSDPHIFAVGDVVEKIDTVTGAHVMVPLAGPANRQGRVAGEVMTGGTASYGTTQGTAICRVGQHTVASTGANEKTLQRLNKAYNKVYVHGNDHAGYYPGASMMTLKILFAPDTGKLLGAQAGGGVGIDKRIDVLAVALRAGLTVYDLEQFELSYAPPFGSAKDILNMAGFIAVNHLRGISPLVTPEQALATSAARLLDVRNPVELNQHGTVPNAINIPLDELRQRLDELDKEQEYWVTCQVGLRAHVATRLLRNHGFRARNITGGYRTLASFMELSS